jgi:hypothetical protein
VNVLIISTHPDDEVPDCGHGQRCASPDGTGGAELLQEPNRDRHDTPDLWRCLRPLLPGAELNVTAAEVFLLANE